MQLNKHSFKALLKLPLEAAAARFGAHRNAGEPRLWILMYHRILPASDSRYSREEPGMLVQPETFRAHIHQLKQLFTILPLTEWLDRYRQGKPLPEKACAITFDDGWADNYEHAFPVIQQEQVPVTLFAVSNMIGSDKQFWPNRITNLVAQAKPEQLATLDWLKHDLARVENIENFSERTATVINHLKRHSDAQLHQWLDSAESGLSISGSTADKLMQWRELKQMSDSGLVDIGSHTCNHVRLGAGLDEAVLRHEIVDSQSRLQQELGKKIELFCYPNGDVSQAALELVKQNYLGAVTTRKGINTCSDMNPCQLLRLGIHQQISDSPRRFSSRVSGWL